MLCIGGVTQVVEHLLCKCEALSSKSRAGGKKEGEKEKQRDLSKLKPVSRELRQGFSGCCSQKVKGFRKN
jgi:hypothetical protein